jgi:hypothetical protein
MLNKVSNKLLKKIKNPPGYRRIFFMIGKINPLKETGTSVTGLLLLHGFYPASSGGYLLTGLPGLLHITGHHL